MKYRNLLLVPLAMTLLAGCDLGGDKGEADPTLYHLTFSSNITLTEEQKNAIKATYGYGEPGLTVVEGTRPQDDIDELKSAGATDADIEKAGKRQADGSYYFFDQDPIYLEAPKVENYKFDGFYFKSTGELADRAKILTGPNGKYRSRWNMEDSNVELEARYLAISYTITFDDMAEDEANPNEITSYKATDGVVTLADATTTNPLKTFECWEYQDTLAPVEGQAPWVELVGGKLPTDYQEDSMRIHAKFVNKQIKVSFAFRKYIDPDTSEPLTFSDVLNSLSVNSNLATVDGVAVVPGSETTLTSSSELKIDGVSGWASIFFELKPEYKISYFELNGVRNEQINAAYMDPPYVSIDQGDLEDDSTITFVVSTVVE